MKTDFARQAAEDCLELMESQGIYLSNKLGVLSGEERAELQSVLEYGIQTLVVEPAERRGAERMREAAVKRLEEWRLKGVGERTNIAFIPAAAAAIRALPLDPPAEPEGEEGSDGGQDGKAN